LKIIHNPQVEKKFHSYPPEARQKLQYLRQLILETASETEGITQIEECLKWGEPSYLTKNGSTIRMDWKDRAPDQYALYFKCTSKLVETFRELYPDTFTFEKNRAIVFKMDEEVPKKELKHCISLALTYHKVKHLPLLGAK
jgi:hypothetical protein